MSTQSPYPHLEQAPSGPDPERLKRERLDTAQPEFVQPPVARLWSRDCAVAIVLTLAALGFIVAALARPPSTLEDRPVAVVDPAPAKM